MTVRLFALRNRAISIIAIAVLAPAATQVAPATAAATSRYAPALLHEGNGLRARPSIRVATLQRALLRTGYHIGAAGVDGRFGPRTAAAVRRLQARAHLEVDGIVGPQTRAALRAPVALGAPTAKQIQAGARTPATVARSTAPVTTPGHASPLQLREASSSPRATLVVGVLGLLIAAACAAELTRRRRRRRAQVAAYMRRPAPPLQLSSAGGAQHPAGTLPGAEDAGAAASDGAATGLGPGAAVIGYATVPAEAGDEHVRSRDRVIEQACARSGWRLVEIVHEPDGGRALERPGLSAALEHIHAGAAQGLVVSDARLMSRAADFAALIQRFREERAPLIALDLGVDTSTREGHRVATALVTLNGWASDRAASRAHGRRNGSREPPPREEDPATP